MYKATFATNMISERVASEKASHEAVRALIPPNRMPTGSAATPVTYR
jgi:hypothetical protein